MFNFDTKTKNTHAKEILRSLTMCLILAQCTISIPPDKTLVF